MIKVEVAKDMRMLTRVEDINSLRSLFQLCSFCVAKIVNMDLCISISGNEVGILIDEERICLFLNVKVYFYKNA